MNIFIKLNEKALYLVFLVVVFIAIFLRVKVYLYSTDLWHDECSLAMNFVSNNGLLSLLDGLDYNQKAPDLFITLVYFLSKIFGTSENSLRIVPFLSSLLSVPAFFLLTKKVLTKNISILLANILFAVNYQLLYFSQNLKQYSSDVLVFILSLLFCNYMIEKENNLKNSILIILFAIFAVLFSFPSVFVIFAFLTIKLIIDFKKDRVKSLIPVFGVFVFYLIYYFMRLLAVQVNEVKVHVGFWGEGFIDIFNPWSFIYVFQNFFKFMFDYSSVSVLGFIFCFIGVCLFVSEKNNFNKMILLSLIFAIFTSMLCIYPILQRASLYLVPILIILIVKPLDFVYSLKKPLSLLLVFSFLLFVSHLNFSYFKQLMNENIFERQGTRDILLKLKSQIKEDDILVTNWASRSDYDYYSNKIGFKKENRILIPYEVGTEKESQYLYFNTLPKGKNYYFCYTYVFYKRGEIELLNSWLKENAQIIQYWEFRNSHLIYARL